MDINYVNEDSKNTLEIVLIYFVNNDLIGLNCKTKIDQ